MKNKLIKYKIVLSDNRKVIENYLFMTGLQMSNSFFYLLIYPYLILKLGIEGYGLFAFATATTAYFIFLINYGFDLPAIKKIAENFDDKRVLNDILSNVFSGKTYIFIFSFFLFFILILNVPIMNGNKLLFSICFASTYSQVLFPQWFFQGIQNMKIVTFIQFGLKILSLPFILIFIKTENDLVIYASIVSLTTFIGSLIAHCMIVYKYKIRIRIVSLFKIYNLFKEAQPFFLSSLAFSIKEYSIPIIVGIHFGMKEVAIFDLANKLILVPRTLLLSLNAAIFPKLIVNVNNNLIKKLIKFETFISFLVILFITIFGKYFVLLMGGVDLIDSYYLSILLSVTVMSFLVVGAYNNFVFIPNNRHYFITKNQTVAMFTFFILCFGSLYFVENNLMVIGVAIATSALIEICYVKYLVKKHDLLKIS